MAYTPNGTNGPNGGRINVNITGNTTVGAGTVISTGTVMLAGGSNVTLSQAGSTITVHASKNHLSRWEHPNRVFAPLANAGQGSLSIKHMYVPMNISGSGMRLAGSLNIGTVAGGTARSGSMSAWLGLYTLTGSTLSISTSGSTNYTFSYHGNSATSLNSVNSSVTGMRELAASMSMNLSIGEYWVGAVVSSSMGVVSANQSFSYSVHGNDQVVGGAGNAVLTPLGSNTTAARDVLLFQGIHVTTAYTMPNNIEGTQINNMGASNVMRANFYNAIYNAMY